MLGFIIGLVVAGSSAKFEQEQTLAESAQAKQANNDKVKQTRFRPNDQQVDQHVVLSKPSAESVRPTPMLEKIVVHAATPMPAPLIPTANNVTIVLPRGSVVPRKMENRLRTSLASVAARTPTTIELNGHRIRTRPHPKMWPPETVTRSVPVLSSPTPWLWFHVHKVSGSLMCLAAKLNRKKIVQPNMNCNWNGVDGYHDSGKPKEEATTCAQRNRYWEPRRFNYGQIERELLPTDFCEGYKYGTMLRDPLDLATSEINYRFTLYKGMTKDEVLTEFMRQLNRTSTLPVGTSQDPEWKFLDNFQTRLFANAFDVPAGGIKEEHVLRAKNTLKKFNIVARMEDVTSFGGAKNLTKAMGWRVPINRMNKVNVSPRKFEFTLDEREMLRKQNKHDYELYFSIDPNSLTMK